jgi:hypothetical protein
MTKYNPVTWDKVKEFIRHHEKHSGVVNLDIATSLGAKYNDVSLLTNLMFKAGEINRIQPEGLGSRYFYTIKE